MTEQMAADLKFIEGRKMLHAGEYEKAIALLTEAIELHPHSHYYQVRADAYRRMGTDDAALADTNARNLISGRDYDSLETQKVDALDESDRMLRRLFEEELVSSVILLAVLALIWGLLSFFLPDGWWHLVINIGAFLVTLAVASSMKRTLGILGVPGWLAFLGAIVIWVLVVGVGRSIEMGILESVL